MHVLIRSITHEILCTKRYALLWTDEYDFGSGVLGRDNNYLVASAGVSIPGIGIASSRMPRMVLKYARAMFAVGKNQWQTVQFQVMRGEEIIMLWICSPAGFGALAIAYWASNC